MKHIFFINSNITGICAYNTIIDLLNRDEDVIVLLVRNTKWQFDTYKARVLDISRLLRFCYNKLPQIRSCNDIITALSLKKGLKKYVSELVEGKEFIMYIPQYHSLIASSFCNHKLCKGYYYLEEGIGAYGSISWNKKAMGYSSLYRLFSFMTGVPYYFAYHTNNKMKGVICLNENAFPWYKGNRILNSCVYNGNKDHYRIERSIIILPPLTGDVSRIMQLVSELISYLLMKKERPIAIKFHPRTGNEERNNLKMFMSSLSGMEIEVFPDDYIVEFNLMEIESALYSVAVKSSLLVYALIFGRDAFYVDHSNNGLKVEQIKSINDAL